MHGGGDVCTTYVPSSALNDSRIIELVRDDAFTGLVAAGHKPWWRRLDDCVTAFSRMMSVDPVLVDRYSRVGFPAVVR